MSPAGRMCSASHGTPTWTRSHSSVAARQASVRPDMKITRLPAARSWRTTSITGALGRSSCTRVSSNGERAPFRATVPSMSTRTAGSVPGFGSYSAPSAPVSAGSSGSGSGKLRPAR